ncbi:MAG TPA: LamG domain-containing protein, partial [Dehalococcoidales bacterium]|nr:LamG domain-containing protein [Dehalococcoidales bacterium]
MAQKCLSFDFIDDYITVPSSDSLNLGTDDITIEMWIKRNTDNLGGQQWLYKKRGAVAGATKWFNLYFQTNNYILATITDNYEVNGYKTFVSSSAITDSNWHYVVAVFDRDGNGTLYVDNVAGTPLDISAVSGSVSNTADALIGAYSTTIRSFDGLIDEVRISNIARGSDEIS